MLGDPQTRAGKAWLDGLHPGNRKHNAPLIAAVEAEARRLALAEARTAVEVSMDDARGNYAPSDWEWRVLPTYERVLAALDRLGEAGA